MPCLNNALRRSRCFIYLTFSYRTIANKWFDLLKPKERKKKMPRIKPRGLREKVWKFLTVASSRFIDLPGKHIFCGSFILLRFKFLSCVPCLFEHNMQSSLGRCYLFIIVSNCIFINLTFCVTPFLRIRLF